MVKALLIINTKFKLFLLGRNLVIQEIMDTGKYMDKCMDSDENILIL